MDSPVGKRFLGEAGFVASTNILRPEMSQQIRARAPRSNKLLYKLTKKLRKEDFSTGMRTPSPCFSPRPLRCQVK